MTQLYSFLQQNRDRVDISPLEAAPTNEYLAVEYASGTPLKVFING